MTEEEWLTCDDSLKALRFLRRRLDPRTVRRPFGRFGDPQLRRKLRLFAGQVALSIRRDQHPDIPEWEYEWLFIQDDIDRWSEGRLKYEDLAGESYYFFCSFHRRVSRSFEVWRSPWTVAARAVGIFLDRTNSRPISAACSLLRDIFGNPFRPVIFSNGWRTDIVVSLAQQIYKSYDFSRLPILADALQDAGCDNEDVLNHCRQPGVHVRGCFVVDLLLGKS